jgi:hypothetical protein
MSSFTDRHGRDALALLQLDSAAREPLVGDDFPDIASALGPAEGLAAMLAAEDYGSEDDDAYWRELQLRQLAEGGGCDYDEYDPANWIHHPAGASIEPEGSRLPGPAERLQADFEKIVGRLRR